MVVPRKHLLGQEGQMLSVEPVGPGKVARFVRYASVHGSEHDDSYLPGAEFRISSDQPSYVLLRDDIVIGAVSLMRTSRYRQAGRPFSIFHTTEPSVRTYSLYSTPSAATSTAWTASTCSSRHSTLRRRVHPRDGFSVERYSTSRCSAKKSRWGWSSEVHAAHDTGDRRELFGQFAM
jgi:hypothetical protein